MTEPAFFEPRYDVAVVGAGFCGSLTAVHLLAPDAGGGEAEGVGPAPASVALIERDPASFGRGVAYGTPCPRHLLNVPAGKMGALPDRSEHFLEWLRAHPAEAAEFGLSGDGRERVGAGTFVPRALYGRYLAALLSEADAVAGGRLRRLAGEVVDLAPADEDDPEGDLRLELADGRRLRARRVVLALGNFPPGDPRLRDDRFHRAPRYLYAPWSAETHERLAAPGDVLILGSGLTGLDLLLTLRDRKCEGVIHVLSRRGLFPQPHRAGLAAQPSFLDVKALPNTVRGLLRALREEIARAAAASGTDWRAVVDALRPVTQDLWRGWDDAERRRFLRHARAFWESHRHRAAPEVLAIKDELVRTGRLVCHRGRVDQITEADAGRVLEVAYKPHGAARGVRERLRVGYVVNCTGPECNYHRLGEPLVVSLFTRGLARPDRLFLGLDADAAGAVRDVHGFTDGRLWTLGSPRRGQLLETTAVPELRLQARELAVRLRRDGRSVAVTTPASADIRTGHCAHAFAFEI